MRIGLLALAPPTLLIAACDQPPQEPDPLEPAPIPEGLAGAAMGPGLYAIGDGASVLGRTRISEDGTFTDLDEAGAAVHSGTWRAVGDTICLDVEGVGAGPEEHCWRNDPPEPDGSFMSRRVDGEKAFRVTPIVEAQ